MLSLALTFVFDNDIIPSIATNKANLYVREFEKFFLYIREEKIIEYIGSEDKRNEHLFSPLDILIFNEVIFYFKLGEYEKALTKILIYLDKIYNINSNYYYKGTIFTNLSLISIIILISLKYEEVAMLMINALETYLFTEFNNKRENGINITKDTQGAFYYLNDCEILNLFSEKWSEIFCFINLFNSFASSKFLKFLSAVNKT